MAATRYQFLPWARRGLAAELLPASPPPARPKVRVGLTITGADTAGVDVRLYGPGDVLGIDPGLIVRTEPRPFATSFEPNLFAAIEFDPPDFPWMLTPTGPTGDKLAPWCVLVVVERRAGVSLRTKAGLPLPVLRIAAPAAPDVELPDLKDSWAWAHAQVTGGTSGSSETIAGELASAPNRNVSRLVCPRRLVPDRDYYACVVPAFDLGVQRGLTGAEPDRTVLAPAWAQGVQSVELPVYHHWEFTTGPAGDFEALARKLRPFKSPADVGTVKMHVGAAGPGLELPAADTGRTLPMDGALRAPKLSSGTLGQVSPTLQAGLERVLNAPAQRVADGAPVTVPSVGPPLYGEWHANVHTIPPARPPWLRELNLDPRARVAAGLGAEVVRANQEDFMAAAWEQVGDVIEANRLLNQARLALEAARRLYLRHLLPLDPAELLQLTGPVQGRTRLGSVNVKRAIGATSLPDAAADTQLRRLTSPQRPLLKAAARRAGKSARTQIVGKLAGGSPAVDPGRFVPDGILRSAALDAVPIPAAGVTADLRSLGYEADADAATLNAGRARVSRVAGALAGGTLKPALRTTLRTDGIVTDEHVDRLLLLPSADAPALGSATLAVLKAATGQTPGKGFLIDAAGKEAVSVGVLDVDAGGGLFLRSSPTRIGTVEPRLQAAPGGIAGAIAGLPPGALDPRTPTPVDVRAGVTAATPVVAGAAGAKAATITLPPLVTDAAVVTRFEAAFGEVSSATAATVDPPEARIVAFVLAPAAATLLKRTDPNLAIPRRVSTMVSIGGRRIGELLGGIIVTPALDRVMVGPEFPAPAYRYLARYDQDRFLPGVDVVPPNAITLLETNPRFVAAFMAGLNHEMNRELLWRGFPGDQRATPFTRFWGRLDGKVDINPMHRWSTTGGLEVQTIDGKPKLVLLVRGDLLRRYPNAVVYAVPSVAGKLSPRDEDVLVPILAGRFAPDVNFIGFDLEDTKLNQNEGWFFVIQEQPTEPRFGLDETTTSAPRSINNLAWPTTGVEPGKHLTPADIKVATSAQFASLTLQRPARVAIHHRHIVTP